MHKLGFKHGAYEGNEQPLPAAFVLDRDRKILFAHYAKNLSDTPDMAKYAELLK